ncbi:MAG: sodium:calcium antiporter [Syntrophobacteraceae bacterium]
MTDTKRFVPIGLAVLFTVPGLFLSLAHLELAPPLSALMTGTAILGASFLLLWACDAAQKDVSQSLALAVVALIAVLPEYAVDMYFTWQAGQHPGSDYAHYAIANMTGANRLLIGVAWSVIAAIFWLKRRRVIQLDTDRRTEIVFLGLATLYAFVIFIKGSLAWYDGVALIGLYVMYIRLASRRPCEACELEGPAELLGRLPKGQRRTATMLLFLFAAGVILANAEPFCESLVATGRVFGINEFLLVQWLAPIASEAPEFTVAIMLALRGHAAVALGSLLSAKLNQWTLLVGMIPGVYALSSASLESPIPMGALQMNEILLTAAQSLLAVALLVRLRLDLKAALLLFGLFIGQFMAPMGLALLSEPLSLHVSAESIHHAFSAFYILTAITLLLKNRAAVANLLDGFKITEAEGGMPAGLVLAESPSNRKTFPREAALERAASRPPYGG